MALLSSARQSSHQPRRGERGYALMAMLLVVALMVITAAVALPSISFEIRRDREQEMIHRGVQYSRAIRAYYKKFGRYPTRLEDLDNTNNLRFLRKRYKDPITGQDFKLLHYGEPGVTLAGGIAGGSIPGANAIGSPGGLNGSSGFAQPSAFGGNANSAFGANTNSNSATSLNSSATNAATGKDPSQASSSANSEDSSSQKISSGGSSDQSSSDQPVTGGPIVGVASVSKKSTIREFNKKKKYNEWQFVYDPSTDRGGLITTPNQPTLQGFGSQPGQGLQPGQGVQPGSPGSTPFGQPSGFGNQTSPFGNSPNSNVPPPVQPPSNPPQQQ